MIAVKVTPLTFPITNQGGGRFELGVDVRLLVTFSEDGRISRTVSIVVPRAFVTDLASVPRILEPIFSITGNNLTPAIIHDYLYAVGALSKKESDKVFYVLMLNYGVKKWRAKLMFWAVKFFGGSSYKGGK